MIRNPPTFLYLSINRSINRSCERKAWSPFWFESLPLLSVYGSIDRSIGLVKEKPGHRFDSKSSHFCLSMDRSIDLSVLWKKAWSPLWFEILPLLSIDWSIDRSIFVVKEKPGQRCYSKSSHFYLSIDRSIYLSLLWKKSLVNVVIRNPPTFVYRLIDLFCQRKPGQRCDSKSSLFYQSFDRSL